MWCLFTKVPIVDSPALLSHHFKHDALALFKRVITSTYFCFVGQFYEQTDGMAMGSPFSPVFANFLMEGFEKNVLEQATHKPVCWFLYLDDTYDLAAWPRKANRISDPPQWI
jgi:hypothetical protein